MVNLPELRLTVFSDYICPFCYVGYHRLMRLRDVYDLKINWCLIEIHPETPPGGKPVSELGYGKTQWQQMMANLDRLAGEEVNQIFGGSVAGRLLSDFVAGDRFVTTNNNFLQVLRDQAALLAARKNKRLVTMAEFEEAKDKVLMGSERRSMVMTEQEKEMTAYHEAGHAIVGRLMPEHDPVHKVTIIPRGRALGVSTFTAASRWRLAVARLRRALGVEP